MNFALFLSPEGIALAHRQDAGHWALIAEQPFAVDDLAARMADLRATIALRGGGDAPVLLVLPDDQILYTSFTAPTHDPGLVHDRITAGLDGLTPYEVSDLVFAWRAVEVDRIKVAVIAAETLEEANAFASAHGFVAAGFAAMPPLERFPGMPIFGEASADVAAATADLSFGPDLWAPPEPEAAPADEMPAAAQADRAASVRAKDDAPPPASAATETAKPKRKRQSRKADGAAAANGPDTAETEPEARANAATPMVAPTQEAAETQPEAPVMASAAPVESAAPATARTGEAKAEGATASAPAQADEAIAEKATAPTPTRTEEAKADEATGPDAPDGSDPPPEMGALAALLDPMFNRTITPIDVAAEDPEPGKSDVAPPAASADAATDSAAVELETPKDTAAPRPDPSQPAAEDAADPQSRPFFGFSTKRRPSGKQAKAVAAEIGDAASKIVTDMRGRLGMAAKPAADAPRHPDVTIAPPRRVATPPAPQGNDLVAQLARLRDISKARPKNKAAPPDDAAPQPEAASAAPDMSPPLDGAMGADDMPPSLAAAGATFDSAPSGATFDSAPSGVTFDSAAAASARPRPAFGNPLPKAATTGTQTPAKQAQAFATNATDAALVSGLLARKPSPAQGPSMRMGLVLTLALLVLLILIAVWSVVFLPDSPMARLFGGGDTEATAQADGDIEPPSPALPATVPAVADAAPPPVDPEALADEDFAEEIAPAADPAPTPAVTAPLPGPVAALPQVDAGQTLPGIDADLDLPPLPPLPEEALPSLAEAEALYASQRIWQRPPDRPAFSPFTLTDDIYIASIDPEIAAIDAVALADPRIDTREVLRRVPTPPPFGARLNRDARGLITPTAEGVLTPEGAFVILGQPAVAALPRPREIAPPPQAPAGLNVENAILRAIQPRPRPINLDETRERQLLGGLSRTELAAMRPTGRPVSAQEDAARASLFPQSQTAASDSPTLVGATARAVAASRVPQARPADFATNVAAATRQPAAPATVTAAAFAPAPSIPSNADVARAATNRNEISLRNINLIGITGTSSNRSALVRLPSGRFVRVAVGDRLDGGRVAAIGATSLQYVVNGRNITLEIPG